MQVETQYANDTYVTQPTTSRYEGDSRGTILAGATLFESAFDRVNNADWKIRKLPTISTSKQRVLPRAELLPFNVLRSIRQSTAI